MGFIIRSQRVKSEDGGFSPVFSGSRGRSLTITTTIENGLSATLNRQRNLFLRGSLAIPDGFTTTRPRTLFAHGRLNGEANVFGSATLDRDRSLFANPNGGAIYAGLAILQRNRTLTVTPHVTHADIDTLNILLTIGGLGAAGFGNKYSGRIIANGVTYPLKAYNYDEGRGDVGITANLTLVRPSDRAAIEAAASFKFDIYDGTGWVNMFDSGKRTGAGFGFAFGDGRPADVLSFATNGDLDNKLLTSPDQDTTIYDSSRLTLNAADYPIVYDTDGNAFIQQLIPFSGLDLYSLLQFVFVTKLGFDGYETTLPNYPIRRADFSITGSYFDGVAGHIGSFSPLIFVKDNVIWLVDSTAPFPPGFGSPVPLNASEYINASLTDTDTNIDAYVVHFADTETEFDYTSNRFIDDPADIVGTFGTPAYTETTKSRTYRDYFKYSNPLVPVRSEKTKEVTTTSGILGGALVTLTTETEEINYDSFARLHTINKTHVGLVPDLAADGFPPAERTIRSERTVFLYGPDRLNPFRQILKHTRKEVSGLVTVDTENKHLGKDFRQQFVEGLAAGNLTADLTVEYAPIQTTTETVQQTEKGQFEIRTRTVDFLADPPQIINSTTDARSGDMSTNSSTGAARTVIVFRPGAVRTGAQMADLSVAELPERFAVPLARRRLARRRIRKGSVALKGLKLTIQRGTMFELFDRDGVSAGIFVCEGRSIAATKLGTAGQETRQIIEVTML